MNLFASADFLDIVGKIYFPSRHCLVEDYEVDGKLFGLLTVSGQGPVVKQTFLDLHEPLGCPSQHSRSKTLRWLPQASHGIVVLEEFKENPAWKKFSAAPTTLWAGFPAWSGYLDLLRSRRVLSDDLRRRRRLEEVVGPLEFMVDDLGADVLPTTFQWKSTQWREAKVIDLFARRQNRDFFHELRARGLLRASSLRARGQLLATWLGAVFQERWYGWVFAFNPEPALAKYSLGRQLLYPMLEESHRAGHKEFDFSIGYEPYKRFFATHVRAVAPLGTPSIHYRLESMVKEFLRDAPRVYETARALRGAFGRAVARIRPH